MRATLTDSPALHNIFGPLPDECRRRLRQLLSDPRRYWDRDHGLAVGRHLTVWQAILAVDPSFPKTGKVTHEDGRIVEDWPRYPDQVLIGRALRYAATVPRRERGTDR